MALNPFQQEVSNLARGLGFRGSAEAQVYQRPEFAQLVNRFFGAIPLPAGINDSMVKSRSASGLTYLDPEGYEHILERNLNAVDPRLGQVTERSTNRPAVLPIEKSNPILGQILGLVNGGASPGTSTGSPIEQLIAELRNPVALSGLDSRTMELLAQMKAAEDQALQEQFDRELGTVVAQLTGSGLGASSIAGETLSRAKQGQGLVRNQAQANQASREIGVRQFLTGADTTRRQGLQAFIQDLLGQGTQREISGAQIGVQEKGIDTQNEQFFSSLQEQIRQFNEQLRMQERQAFINNLFKGIAAGTSIATGVGRLFGGGSAFSGGGSLGSFQIPPFQVSPIRGTAA